MLKSKIKVNNLNLLICKSKWIQVLISLLLWLVLLIIEKNQNIIEMNIYGIHTLQQKSKLNYKIKWTQ